MKFLCPNCKAKYQIADEKIGGRTLKMDCRRCQHTIVLRGDQPQSDDGAGEGVAAKPAAKSTTSRHGAVPAGAASQPAAAARRPAGTSRGGSHVGPAPARPAPRSALSADFRRNAGAPAAPEAPARATPLDQWHVAINDVPVGPMRRDEIARKISTGAIHQDSLAWREGFDDWRPLREIPELSALLRRSEAGRTSDVPRPPSARMPAAGARPAAPASRPGAARPGSGTSRPAASPAAARSNVVAIGGRLGASAAPAIEEDEPLDELEGEPTRVASSIDFAAELAAAKREEAAAKREEAAAKREDLHAAKPAARTSVPPAAPVAQPAPAPERISVLPDPFAAPPPASAGSSSHGMAAVVAPAPARERERERRGLPVGAWIGIAGAMAFGVAMAVMIAPRLLGPSTAPAVAPAIATTTVAAPPTTGPIEAPVDTAPVAPPPSTEPVAAAPIAAPAEPHHATHPAGGGATATKAPAPARTGAGTGTGATAATKVASGRFAAFADDGAGVAAIDTRATPSGSHSSEGHSAAGSGDLSADQVRNVVSRGQRELQRCWELEIRGMRDVQTTRMDVDITIGASGTVTRASARGVGIGNLPECIERNVRRWHFPPSGGETQTSFPVVFTGV